MNTWPEQLAAAIAVVSLVAAFLTGRGWGLRTALRTTVTSAVDDTFGIAAFTLDGRLISANDRFLRIVGYKLGDIRGRRHELFRADRPAADEGELWDALRRGERRTGVFQWTLAGGARVWIGAAYHPVVRRGRVHEVVAFVNDVTERREQDAKYRELAAIVEAADDAIVGTDLDGTVRSWNPGAERLLGYTTTEAIGRSGDWLAPADGVELERAVAERLKRGESVSQVETARVRKDGSTITVALSAFPIRNEIGQITGFAKVARDITDRKQAEARLASFAAELEKRNVELAEARDRALAATRAKSAFLATMSHEIRTPMNAVLGMAELLGETALSAEQREYVGRLSRGAGNLLELVNDVLDISKIEADSLHLESVSFDLTDVVDHVTELMSVRAAVKQVELTALVEPEVPAFVVGDPTRLRQVLLNLVGNAVKFTEHGEVRVRVSAQRKDGPACVRFAVSDTGIGIPADRLDSIFDSFSQVDSSTTRRYGGTGLGLSISRRLVEMMGGRLSVASTPGQGSTFSFCAQLPAGEPPRDQHVGELDLHGRRVLIVDDHETNRLIVRSHCERAGAAYVEAADGARAIIALNELDRRGVRLDAAILDLQMPGMDGFELAQAIRGRSATAAMPIVLCASEMSADRGALAASLNLRVVYKPLGRRRLFDALARGLAPDTAPPVAAPTEQPAPVAAARILLVEDLEDNRDLVALFLKDTPHTLVMAENGAIGFDRFREGAFDLVLTDVQMPVMDGHALTRAIREWERAHARRATPVVALTASALQDDVDRAIAAGCDAHLTKPIRKPSLLAAVAQHAAVRREQSLPAAAGVE